MRRKKRPVLLLDVDGVLNVTGPDIADRTVKLKPDDHPFHPTPFVKKFLPWAWSRFRVIWCTAWMDSANKIARWAGLPEVQALRALNYERRLMTLSGLKDPKKWLQQHGDWKLDAAKKVVSSGETIFWMEDGITELAQKWLERRRGYYLATDSFEGVTRSHVRILERLI